MTSVEVSNPTVKLVDSSPLLNDTAALTERAEQDGYLFFRGLLNRDRVLGLRRQIMEIVGGYGWLADGTDPIEGVADREAFSAVPEEEFGFCGTGVPLHAYQDINRLQEFHAIGHDPALMSLYSRLLGDPVLRHPMSIARVMVPSDEASPTPPHQDFIHIQGSKNVRTAWFPLGDCPTDLGGLAVLVGSHADGLLTYHAAKGAGDLEAYICDSGYSWATTDFRAGDVLTFNSLVVHRGMPNLAGTNVRLSLDLRYQRADEPITTNCLGTHCDVLDWDEVYRDWTDTSLQYYWQDFDLDLVEHSTELKWQKHKIC